MDSHTVISVIVPLRDDGDILASFLRELSVVLDASFRYYEIILVDDGSRDDTASKISGELANLQRIRYVRLSRSFGKDVAICAGLESAIGDFVVTMDPNTDPCASIPDLVEQCRADGELMHGRIDKPPGRGWCRDFAGNFFRKYVDRRLGFKLHHGSTDFRVMSRQAVNSLLQIRGKEHYLRIFISSLGFRQQTFEYAPVNRRGSIRTLPLSEEISTAIDILTLHTRHPLRVAGLLGLGVAALNLLYAGYVVAIYLIKPDVAAGWTTTSLQLSGMFFFLFLLLSVLSEYVGSLLMESRVQPSYFIAEEKNSSVLLEDTFKSSVIRQDQ